ncbi:MAG: hypothetical protein DCF31_10700, partial [Alphaproteobacteria bacterium]
EGPPDVGGAGPAVITINIVELGDRQAAERREREEALRELFATRPQQRIDTLYDPVEPEPDPDGSDPVTGDGNPALWLDTPPAAAPAGEPK